MGRGARLIDKVTRGRPIRGRASAEDLAWLGTVPAVAIMLVAFEWVAPSLGDHLFPPTNYGFFQEWLPIVRPEPLEQTRFVIAVAIPLVLAGAIVAFGADRVGKSRFDVPIVAVQVAIAGFVIWSVARQPGEENPPVSRSDYFDPLLVSVPVLVAGLVIGLVATFVLLTGVRPGERARRIAERAGRRSVLALGAAVLLTALWLAPAIITEGRAGLDGEIHKTHIDFQLADYLSVTNGRTPLVDFVPRYAALLSLPVAPILQTFDLSVTAFTITLTALSAIGLLCIYAAFAQVTSSRWAAFGLYVPFLAISLFPWSDIGVARDFNGNYYALFPNRYLGPFVVAWLCARHLRRGSPPLAVVYFAAGLTLLNNFEFGLSCLLALTVAVLLADERARLDRRRLGERAVHAGAGLLGSLALVSVVILIRSGELPDIGLIGYFTRIFGKEAYSLLPMPTWGLHCALYVTYVGALLLACVRQVGGSSDRTLTGMLAFAGIFGLFTGGYFAGRSDPFGVMSLFPVWGLAIALLAWATVPVWRESHRDRTRLRRLIVPVCAVMVGFGVAVAAIARFPSPTRELDRLSESGPAIFGYEAHQEFVENRTSEGEPVLIMATSLDHRIAERAGVNNVSPWGGVDFLFSRREVDRALDRLEEEGGRKLFEGFGDFVFPEPFHSAVPILRERGFRIVARDEASGLREWILD